MKYIINNKTFNQKTDIKKYFKEIKDKYPVNTCLKEENEEEYNDVIEFFKNHHEYEEKTKDMKDIIIKFNAYYDKAYYILKNDNTTLDISYLHAYNCIGKTLEQILRMVSKKDLNLAFRYCVKQQSLDFRKTTNQICCQFCGSKNQLEVDHELEFKNIVKMFLKQNKTIVPVSFDDDEITHQPKFKQEDKNFNDDFFKFHLEHFAPRLLCKKCNLSRNKKNLN